MPITRKVDRNKYATISLIVSSVICLIPVIILIFYYEGFYDFNLWLEVSPYSRLSLALLATNVVLGVLFGFVIRRHKVVYIASIIGLFLAIVGFGVISFSVCANNFYDLTYFHFTWIFAFMLFFYLVGEAFPKGIYARIYGPVITAALCLVNAAVAISFFRGDSLQTAMARNLTMALIFIVISGVLSLIFLIISLTKKSALATLGSKKVIYDIATKDEIELDDRKSIGSADFSIVPNLYEGFVYKLNDSFYSDIMATITNFYNRCLNEMADVYNRSLDYIQNKEELNSLKKLYARWQEENDDDYEKLVAFAAMLRDARFLSGIDKGNTLVFSFNTCTHDYEPDFDNPDGFRVSIRGYTRNFVSVVNCFDTAKGSVDFDVPSYSVVREYYHNASLDSERDEPGYHLPGTPMLGEDD